MEINFFYHIGLNSSASHKAHTIFFFTSPAILHSNSTLTYGANGAFQRYACFNVNVFFQVFLLSIGKSAFQSTSAILPWTILLQWIIPYVNSSQIIRYKIFNHYNLYLNNFFKDKYSKNFLIQSLDPFLWKWPDIFFFCFTSCFHNDGFFISAQINYQK
jgi:hypothetical protein